MERRAVLLTAVPAFLGGAVVALALTWAADRVAGSDGRDGFCAYVEQWQGLATEVARTANTIERGRASGWRQVEQAYANAALVAIPAPPDVEARALADMIASWNAAEEKFISRSRLHAVVTAEISPADSTQRITAFLDMEDARIEANDRLRRLNPYLQSTCDIGPVDPYSE
jgi:hypothetical protein